MSVLRCMSLNGLKDVSLEILKNVVLDAHKDMSPENHKKRSPGDYIHMFLSCSSNTSPGDHRNRSLGCCRDTSSDGHGDTSPEVSGTSRSQRKSELGDKSLRTFGDTSPRSLPLGLFSRGLARRMAPGHPERVEVRQDQRQRMPPFAQELGHCRRAVRSPHHKAPLPGERGRIRLEMRRDGGEGSWAGAP